MHDGHDTPSSAYSSPPSAITIIVSRPPTQLNSSHKLRLLLALLSRTLPPTRDGATRLPTSSQHRPSKMADQGDSTLIPPRKQERKRFKPTSRPRPPVPGQEKAEAVLELGEFQEVDTLTLSEASLVINALVTKRRMDRKNVNETEMLTQTLNYLDAFSRFRQKENVEAVERLLSAHKQLAKFERAQIGSLCCETAEEAKTLIPSLQDKITDEDLQELLDEISKLQSR
ncbi:hypothetical protein BN1708_000473 [Verticillium longisporum]|uniref:RNA polymerase Rpb4/RPC9 core domain-containing protein n=3 Tax=Verticillium TaxID=1036719 RepID=A0A0G4LCV0_VERLO|nr:hypothetical protein BN1708_000473 [Verticillium longisporum]